eukprot:13809-Heterococcus_DN1.PRE.2
MHKAQPNSILVNIVNSKSFRDAMLGGGIIQNRSSSPRRRTATSPYTTEHHGCYSLTEWCVATSSTMSHCCLTAAQYCPAETRQQSCARPVAALSSCVRAQGAVTAAGSAPQLSSTCVLERKRGGRAPLRLRPTSRGAMVQHTITKQLQSIIRVWCASSKAPKLQRKRSELLGNAIRERESVQINLRSVAHLPPSLIKAAAKGLRRLPNLTGLRLVRYLHHICSRVN